MHNADDAGAPWNNHSPLDHVGSNAGQGGCGDNCVGHGHHRHWNRAQCGHYQGQHGSFEGENLAFNNTSSTPDQYPHTTQEIINFIRTTYTKHSVYTSDSTEAQESLELDDPVEPALPNTGNQVPFELWKMDIKEF